MSKSISQIRESLWDDRFTDGTGVKAAVRWKGKVYDPVTAGLTHYEVIEWLTDKFKLTPEQLDAGLEPDDFGYTVHGKFQSGSDDNPSDIGTNIRKRQSMGPARKGRYFRDNDMNLEIPMKKVTKKANPLLTKNNPKRPTRLRWFS